MSRCPLQSRAPCLMKSMTNGFKGGPMQPTSSISTPRFTLGEVADAASMSVKLLKNWTDRKVFEPDQDARGAGTRALFSLGSALEIALARELVEMGLSPIRGAEIAGVWTHTSFGPGPDDPGRPVGGLFGGRYWTVLAFSAGGGDATIRAVDPVKTLASEAFLWVGMGDWKRVSLVVLDPIRDRVTKALLG